MISLASWRRSCSRPSPRRITRSSSVPDAKKGEQLVMFTTDETLDARKVGEGLKAVNATTLMMPAPFWR